MDFVLPLFSWTSGVAGGVDKAKEISKNFSKVSRLGHQGTSGNLSLHPTRIDQRCGLSCMFVNRAQDHVATLQGIKFGGV
jgi:hypothetical protein